MNARITRDTLPAMRTRDVRHDAMPERASSGHRIRLVEPTRLRDTNRTTALDARGQVEQRNLHCARQLPGECAIARMLKKHESCWRGHEYELPPKVCRSHRGG